MLVLNSLGTWFRDKQREQSRAQGPSGKDGPGGALCAKEVHTGARNCVQQKGAGRVFVCM